MDPDKYVKMYRFVKYDRMSRSNFDLFIDRHDFQFSKSVMFFSRL